MDFSDKDKEFMKIALEEAREALEKGDYPVGSVLVVDGEVLAQGRNSTYSEENWSSHAEANLLKQHSKFIKEKRKNDNSKVELYTTLEPCLMCMGISVYHRISRIVYGCPDPCGGAAHINPKNLSEWYADKWPEVEGGLFQEESYQLMIEFFKTKSKEDKRHEKHRKIYEEMHDKW